MRKVKNKASKICICHLVPKGLLRKMKRGSKYSPSKRRRLRYLDFTEEEKSQLEVAYQKLYNIADNKCEVMLDGTCREGRTRGEHSTIGVYWGTIKPCKVCKEYPLELILHKPVQSRTRESRPDNALRFLAIPIIRYLDETTLGFDNAFIRDCVDEGGA